MSSKSSLRWLVRYGVSVASSLAAIVWVFSLANVAELKESFANFPIAYTVPIVLIYLAGFLIRGWKWRLALQPIAEISWKLSTSAVILGYAVNNVLPGRLGEVVRALTLNRYAPVSKSAALMSVIVERIFDGAILLLIFAVSTLGVQVNETLYGIGVMGVVVCGAALSVIVLMAVRPQSALIIVRAVLHPFGTRIQEAVTSIAENGIEAMQFMKLNRRFVLFLLLCMAVWVVEGAMFWLTMWSMGLSSHPAVAYFTLAVVNLGILVPAAPGYVGVFQAAGVLALTACGMNATDALAFTIVIHALQYLPITLAGFALVPALHVSMRVANVLEIEPTSGSAELKEVGAVV